jgi:hypothetical protein
VTFVCSNLFGQALRGGDRKRTIVGKQHDRTGFRAGHVDRPLEERLGDSTVDSAKSALCAAAPGGGGLCWAAWMRAHRWWV